MGRKGGGVGLLRLLLAGFVFCVAVLPTTLTD